MANLPIKKVRRIEVDEDSGEPVYSVYLEVPEFQNFGQRLGELELKCWRAQFDDPPDKDQFTHNLQRIRVALPEGVEWDKTSEAEVDQFLIHWPEMRPGVLEAVFNFYKKVYPQAIHPFRDVPGKKFTLPEPTSAEVVADLFCVKSLYLHSNGETSGISGNCTWDMEHCWGALLRDGKVAEVGGIDEAFESYEA
jgi:hypothetical protein